MIRVCGYLQHSRSWKDVHLGLGIVGGLGLICSAERVGGHAVAQGSPLCPQDQALCLQNTCGGVKVRVPRMPASKAPPPNDCHWGKGMCTPTLVT